MILTMKQLKPIMKNMSEKRDKMYLVKSDSATANSTKYFKIRATMPNIKKTMPILVTLFIIRSITHYVLRS